MTQIEIGAPASLPLALARFENGTAGLLGAALQFPPLNLSARASEALSITGARADAAFAAAARFLKGAGLPEQGTIEIELAIPSQMGLGSEAHLALGAAQALAWAHNQGFADVPALAAAAGLGAEHSLEIHAYAQGGVLLVDFSASPVEAPAPPRRRMLAHRPEAAWVFVLFLPRVGAGTPSDLEAERLAALRRAVPHLPARSGELLEAELWPALVRDDFGSFAQALGRLQTMSTEALEAAGAAAPMTDEEAAILRLCQANGAVVGGRSLTGLALFALIQGASASVALRRKLAEHVGIRGGTVLGSIVDNRGARHAIHDTPPIYTGASPLVSGTRPNGS